MQSFVEYWNERHPNDEYPTTESVSGEWFASRNLPMIVACCCCEMTMALPSARIDEEGYIVCSGCAE